MHFKLNESIVNVSELELIYLIWGIVSLIIVAWYFKRARVNTSEEQINLLSEKYRKTEREKDIILMVSKDLSNKELCDKLFISMATVKTHIRNIYEKTGARNRVELLNLFKK